MGRITSLQDSVRKFTNLLATSGVGFVAHGTDPYAERPSEFGSIQWIGSVEPENALDGDVWLDTTIS